MDLGFRSLYFYLRYTPLWTKSNLRPQKRRKHEFQHTSVANGTIWQPVWYIWQVLLRTVFKLRSRNEMIIGRQMGGRSGGRMDRQTRCQLYPPALYAREVKKLWTLRLCYLGWKWFKAKTGCICCYNVSNNNYSLVTLSFWQHFFPEQSIRFYNIKVLWLWKSCTQNILRQYFMSGFALLRGTGFPDLFLKTKTFPINLCQSHKASSEDYFTNLKKLKID